MTARKKTMINAKRHTKAAKGAVKSIPLIQKRRITVSDDSPGDFWNKELSQSNDGFSHHSLRIRIRTRPCVSNVWGSVDGTRARKDLWPNRHRSRATSSRHAIRV